jgi:hypothetical protein
VVIGVGVAPTLVQPILATLFLAEAAARERLPPPTRAAVLMALLAIALLGMLLVVIILLGGHWARRQGTYRRGPSVPPDRRPIVTPPSGAPSREGDDLDREADDPASTGETIVTRDTLRDKGPPS